MLLQTLIFFINFFLPPEYTYRGQVLNNNKNSSSSGGSGGGGGGGVVVEIQDSG